MTTRRRSAATTGSRALGFLSTLGACMLGACSTESASTAPVASQTSALWGGVEEPALDGVVLVGHSRQPPGCSGTLIAPNLAITAQHCVAQVLNTTNVDVCTHEFGPVYERPYVMLADSLFGPSEIILASDVILPEACTSTCGCDIALLILERSVPDPSIVIGVQNGRLPFAEQSFDLVAFGTTSSMGGGFGVRRRRAVKVQCFSWGCGIGALAANEFAATSGGCEGDSGGPGIDDQGLLLGVISRTSFPCESPDAVNLYTSTQWMLDLITATARTAAERGGYPLPDWAESTASVCATPGSCGPHMEADGTEVDCGACIAPEACGADGMCASPIAAPDPIAGAGGGSAIGDLFQGDWCDGVVCPVDWVCAGEPPTCAMACDPAKPVCDEGTTCDTAAGACLPNVEAAGAAGANGDHGDGGGCTIRVGRAAPTHRAVLLAALLLGVCRLTGRRRARAVPSA